VIASLSGTVAHISSAGIVVEVGGVGIAVQCPTPVLLATRVAQHVTFSTSLVVREDSLTLFGFLSADDRDVFETLQSVSGVGPRVAVAVLSAMSADDLRRAVHAGDEVSLTKVSGIGKKGAQRLVLELGDKLTSAVGTPADVRASSTSVDPQSWQPQVQAALVSLGWSQREADIAVEESLALKPDDPDLSDANLVSTMLGIALRGLSRS